jgi:hypothetical protein
MGAVNEKIRVESECIINISGIPFTGMQGNLFSCPVCVCYQRISTGYVPGAADPQSIGTCFPPVTPENERPE